MTHRRDTLTKVEILNHPDYRNDRVGKRAEQYKQHEAFIKTRPVDKKLEDANAAFLVHLGYPRRMLLGKYTRYDRLVDERIEEAYIKGKERWSKSRWTKEGVTGWYLNRDIEEPHWINRKVPAYRNRFRSPPKTSALRDAYQKIKLGYMSSDYVLTPSNQALLRSMWRRKVEVKQPEQVQSEQQAALANILASLAQVERAPEESRVSEEAEKWAMYQRKAERKNRKLFEDMENGGEALWRRPGEEKEFKSGAYDWVGSGRGDWGH